MASPRYLECSVAEIRQRAGQAVESLRDCRVCPRDCRIDRLNGETKVCATGRWSRVSTWYAHFGEENCLRGKQGSGTIFFAFCNLKCVFCQNHDTSQAGAGRELSAEQLAAAMLDLQHQGCHNINLVTPEHVVPQVLEALPIAIERGLTLPLVYNTSGYDSLASLRALDGLVDIYMPDLKLLSARGALRYLKAKDYPNVAIAAIREMHRQVGDLEFDSSGLASSGLLVRHLVMPSLLEESARVFDFLAREISTATYINVMAQYRPEYRARDFPEIARRPTLHELRHALRLAREAGLYRFDSHPKRYIDVLAN